MVGTGLALRREQSILCTVAHMLICYQNQNIACVIFTFRELFKNVIYLFTKIIINNTCMIIYFRYCSGTSISCLFLEDE